MYEGQEKTIENSSPSFADEIVFFRHILFPEVIIESPRFIVSYTDNDTNETFKYGCFVLPSEWLYAKELVYTRGTDRGENYTIVVLDTVSQKSKSKQIKIHRELT